MPNLSRKREVEEKTKKVETQTSLKKIRRMKGGTKIRPFFRAHIAERLNSGFDREIGALVPHIYYINWGGLVRASGYRSGFRRPAMWALLLCLTD
jgi:hypothetical protein